MPKTIRVMPDLPKSESTEVMQNIPMLLRQMLSEVREANGPSYRYHQIGLYSCKEVRQIEELADDIDRLKHQIVGADIRDRPNVLSWFTEMNSLNAQLYQIIAHAVDPTSY